MPVFWPAKLCTVAVASQHDWHNSDSSRGLSGGLLTNYRSGYVIVRLT